jgi:hypothetical protein
MKQTELREKVQEEKFKLERVESFTWKYLKCQEIKMTPTPSQRSGSRSRRCEIGLACSIEYGRRLFVSANPERVGVRRTPHQQKIIQK